MSGEDIGEGGRKEGEFDWLVGWAEVEALLHPGPEGLLGPYSPAQCRTVVLGCGQSALSASLVDKAGFREVTSVDREEDIIDHMRSRRPDLTWAVADLQPPPGEEAAGEPLPEAAFDLALDKGTLDAIQTEYGNVAGLACAVWRALAPGGVWFIVSLYPPELLRPLLAPAGGGGLFEVMNVRQIARRTFDNKLFDFDGRCGAEGAQVTAMALAKAQGGAGAGAGADQAAVAKQQRGVVEWWFKEHAPLLTAARERTIREAFAAALEEAAGRGEAAGDGALSLKRAHSALFTREEREEYLLEDFLGDVAASREPGAGGGGGMTLEEALAFIAANQ